MQGPLYIWPHAALSMHASIHHRTAVHTCVHLKYHRHPRISRVLVQCSRAPQLTVGCCFSRPQPAQEHVSGAAALPLPNQPTQDAARVDCKGGVGARHPGHQEGPGNRVDGGVVGKPTLYSCFGWLHWELALPLVIVVVVMLRMRL